MIVISPARADERIALDVEAFGGVIRAAGSDRYAFACFELFEQSLDAEHWALFQYRSTASMRCLATASRNNMAAAKQNIDKFVGRCHSFDPSFIALKRRRDERECLTKIDIEDIRDRQYRQCFEATQVQERLSLFSRTGPSLYQLSIFRGPTKRRFSAVEMEYFAALAGLVLETALHHQTLGQDPAPLPGPLDLEAIERRLQHLPGELSKREREVCSRAVAGQTIEGTALDLNIQKTSVITYRQRAYQKLGISRQSELVALVNNLRPSSVSVQHAAQPGLVA